MANAQKDRSKVEEYRRTLHDLARHPIGQDGKKREAAIALEGKAAKLATEIQGEESKTPKTRGAQAHKP